MSVKVYITELPEKYIRKELYPREKQAEIDSAKSPKVKIQKQTAWELLATALNEFIGKDISQTDIKRESGKWELSGCFISLSHTDGYAAVALADLPVGVDIEKVIGRQSEKLYNKITSEKEREVFGVYTAEKAAELWTAKESVFKRIGGDKFIPRNIDVTAEKYKTLFLKDLNLVLTVSCENLKDLQIIKK